MRFEVKNNLMRAVLQEARYCIPDTIVESLVKVFGQYVLDHSKLTDKEKREIIVKALDMNGY